MHLVILGVDIAWNAIVETFTEGGGFVSKHLGNPLGNPGNPLLSTGRSDSSFLILTYSHSKYLVYEL